MTRFRIADRSDPIRPATQMLPHEAAISSARPIPRRRLEQHSGEFASRSHECGNLLHHRRHVDPCRDRGIGPFVRAGVGRVSATSEREKPPDLAFENVELPQGDREAFVGTASAFGRGRRMAASGVQFDRQTSARDRVS